MKLSFLIFLDLFVNLYAQVCICSDTHFPSFSFQERRLFARSSHFQIHLFEKYLVIIYLSLSNQYLFCLCFIMHLKIIYHPITQDFFEYWIHIACFNFQGFSIFACSVFIILIDFLNYNIQFNLKVQKEDQCNIINQLYTQISIQHFPNFSIFSTNSFESPYSLTLDIHTCCSYHSHQTTMENHELI